MTKNGGQMKYRPEYMDSMKMILDRFSIQSFDKDKMILTINSKKTAYMKAFQGF